MSVLLGQGAGGGALALLPADRTIAAQHAWLSPLPPEGASAIVHRSTEFAPAMSEAQGVNVASLYANGIVDHIVDERPDAALGAARVLPQDGAGDRIRARDAVRRSRWTTWLSARMAKYQQLGTSRR